MEKIEETLDEKIKKYVSFKENLEERIKKYSNVYLVISCAILTIIAVLYIWQRYSVSLFWIIYIIVIICLVICHSCLLHYFYSIWFEKKLEVYKNTFK